MPALSERPVPPDFELPAPGNQRFQLSALKGHPFLVYFHPKDPTPGHAQAVLGRLRPAKP